MPYIIISFQLVTILKHIINRCITIHTPYVGLLKRILLDQRDAFMTKTYKCYKYCECLIFCK